MIEENSDNRPEIYAKILDEVCERADGTDETAVINAAEAWVFQRSGQFDEERQRSFFTAIVGYSIMGPRDTFTELRFDHTTPLGSIRSLAASAVAHDIIYGVDPFEEGET